MPYIDGEDSAAITQSDSLDMVQHLIEQQPDHLYIAGSRLTAAYMVAVNHLGGLLLPEAGRVGIYRCTILVLRKSRILCQPPWRALALRQDLILA